MNDKLDKLTLLPFHGPCFTCGTENPTGMGLTYYLDESTGFVHVKVTYVGTYEGPPGHVHGGALFAVMDEAMSKAAWVAGHRVLAAHLEIDYKQPVPLGQEMEVVGRLQGRDGRKVTSTGELFLPDGSVAATSMGLFVVVAEDFFDGAHEEWYRR